MIDLPEELLGILIDQVKGLGEVHIRKVIDQELRTLILIEQVFLEAGEALLFQRAHHKEKVPRVEKLE